jgi:hypothetical protein
MKLKQLLLTAVVISLSFVESVWAADFQYYVFPVSTGISGIFRTASQTDAAAQLPKNAMINSTWQKLVFDDNVSQLILKSFERKLAEKYPYSIVDAAQVNDIRTGKYTYEPRHSCGDDFNFRAPYKDTFAVSVGISRLSAYVNSYDQFTQILIPITYTLRFIKLDGASIVYSLSLTNYTQYTALTASLQFNPDGGLVTPDSLIKIKEAVLQDGIATVSQLVDDSAAKFKPKAEAVNIASIQDGLYIFDKGSEIGFGSGTSARAIDSAGHDIYFTVLYATEGISIGRPEKLSAEDKRAVNTLREGSALTFIFSKQGKDDEKPTILATQYETPPNGVLTTDQQISNSLLEVLVSDIGFKTPFNIIKTDPDFLALQYQIKATANCFDLKAKGFEDSTSDREPPSLFLKLSTYSSPKITSSGVGNVVQTTEFNNAVGLSLVDSNNIVRQFIYGTSPYSLKVAANKGLSVDQATEVALKNATIVAGKNLVSQFNPTAQVIKIKSVNGHNAQLTMPMSSLMRDGYRLVTPISVEKLKRTINLPIPSEKAALDLPEQSSTTVSVRGSLKASDLIVVSQDATSKIPLTNCPVSRNREFFNNGLTTSSKLSSFVEAAVGSGLKSYQLLEPDQAFVQSKSALLKRFFDRDSSPSSASSPSTCIAAVENLDFDKKPVCSVNKCTGIVKVGTAVRLYDAENKKIAESLAGNTVDMKDLDPSMVSNFAGFKAFESFIGSLTVHKAKINQ